MRGPGTCHRLVIAYGTGFARVRRASMADNVRSAARQWARRA